MRLKKEEAQPLPIELLEYDNFLGNFNNGKMNLKISCWLMLGFVLPMSTLAQNPIVQTYYTADPAPMVHGDTVYLYTTHDEDIVVNGFFTMNDWKCYTTTDMVNWTDRGTVLSYTDFSWASGDAWAGQCIFRNGKYYFYVPVNQKTGGNAIGVAVSDSPTGPFKDALGKPLLVGYGYIDPTVFIDDDGQAYLYWGNPELCYVKLNDDMTSYNQQSGVVKVDLTVEGFGPRSNTDRATSYEEGPWLHKHNNTYYLLYPGGPVPEHLAYSTSNSPTGPWSYGGKIMNTISDKGAFTNHPGLIEFKGKPYLFYHNAALPGGGGFNRSVCVEEFAFNADGSIPLIEPTSGVENAVVNLNPYQLNQAENIAWSEGLKTAFESNSGVYVTNIDNNDFIKVRNVDFGSEGATVFSGSVSCDTKPGINKGGFIEIHLDKKTGTLIGTLPVSYTGGSSDWMTEKTNVSGASGMHDVYFVFKSETSNAFNFNSWNFVPKSVEKKLLAINASSTKYKIDTLSGNNSTAIKVVALFSDGTSEDITSKAAFQPEQAGLVSVENGMVNGIGCGTAIIKVEYEGFSDEIKFIVKNLDSELTVGSLTANPATVELMNGSTTSISVVANYLDGHQENVTDMATYSNPSPSVTSVSKGVIKAVGKGETIITASYKGKMGESKSTTIAIAVVNRSPYNKTEAENFDEQSGIQTEDCTDTGGGKNIGFVENGDWIKINALDFDKGAISFALRAASGSGGGKVELRVDSRTGKLVGTCSVNGTGGWQSWLTKTCDIADLSGVHDLYMVFTGGSGYLFNLNWWTFKAKPLSASLNEKPSIVIETRNHEKYLNGLYPTDQVTLFTMSGQKIASFKANSETIKLERTNGLVIIEINRGSKKLVLKTVL